MFAEWDEQRGIVLIYPHYGCFTEFEELDKNLDSNKIIKKSESENSKIIENPNLDNMFKESFKEGLNSAQDTFDNLLFHITKSEKVFLIIHPDDPNIKMRVDILFQNYSHIKSNCKIFEIETNDIWARDTIAISIKNTENIKIDSKPKYLNFGFNGWGLKFKANLDNNINNKLKNILFDNLETVDIVLEGGSIDCNGNGILLTNTQCLLESNRNPSLSKNEIEKKLKKYLKLKEIIWLNHGFLKGDDTDSHIDTLARFINKNTIAYIKCEEEDDEHFRELFLMEKELEAISKKYKFNLLPLPYCNYIYNANHYPASYINFLFLNKNVILLPTYNKPTDSIAIQTIQNFLKHYKVIPIDCRSLIMGGGSLHCVSMQIY